MRELGDEVHHCHDLGGMYLILEGLRESLFAC